MYWMLRSRLPSVSQYKRFSTCSISFSGHNKWSKIKQRKGAEDAKKSILYGKAARDILAAARNGGSPIPEENSMLATVIRRAKDAGVPKENIENVLVKAFKNKSGSGQVVTYEAMMHGSIGIIIECRTENVNRTLSNVRETLTRHGARQAPVKFMFRQRGYLKIAVDPEDIEDLFNTAESTQHAFDFDEWEDESSASHGIELSCSPDHLLKLRAALLQYIQHNAKAEILACEVRWAPLEEHESTEHEKNSVSTLVESLEEDEDVTLDDRPKDLRLATTLSAQYIRVKAHPLITISSSTLHDISVQGLSKIFFQTGYTSFRIYCSSKYCANCGTKGLYQTDLVKIRQVGNEWLEAKWDRLIKHN